MALASDDMGGAERGDAMRLVSAHRSGDTSAFTEIVRTHYPTLLACARRRLASSHDAEDAVQDAFLRAYRRLETFGSEGDWRMGAWLNTILSNVCSDILARRRPTAPFDEWADGRADSLPDAADLVSDTVVHDAIVEAIATLPRTQRNAFLLRMVDDRPYGEVAATLGITEDNARARVARARSSLQRVLSKSEALTGMLAAAPLFVAGSLRTMLRRIFSSHAGDPAHVTAATLAPNAAGAAEAAASNGPLGSGMQLLGQLASTPAAQVALAASTGSAGRGSTVLGVFASLAAAGGLSVPAVAAATAPSAAAQTITHLGGATPSATPATPAAGAAPAAAGAAQGSSTASVPSATSGGPAAGGPEPSWFALAESAKVDGRPAGTASPGSTPLPGGGAPVAPAAPAPIPATQGSPAPAAAAPAPTPTTASTGATLAPGSCTAVAGFPGVGAPTSVPPLTSDELVSVLSTAAQELTSTSGGPAFQTTGSTASTGSPAVPVTVTAGTCLAEGGSILAADMTGATGAEVQLVGSLVSTPVTTATGVDYLFRGQVTQIAGTVLAGGRLPWNLSSSFVAELQVQSGTSASLEVVFVKTLGTGTSPTSSPLPTTSTSAGSGSAGTTPQIVTTAGTTGAAVTATAPGGPGAAATGSTSSTGSTGATTSTGTTSHTAAG